MRYRFTLFGSIGVDHNPPTKIGQPSNENDETLYELS
jgi:hypothetical protein